MVSEVDARAFEDAGRGLPPSAPLELRALFEGPLHEPCHGWLLRRRGRAVGGLRLEAEPFDSDVFGVAIGRLAVVVEDSAGGRQLLGAGLRRAAATGYRQVVSRCRANDRAALRALLEKRFFLVDVALCFERAIDGRETGGEDGVRAARENDLEPLIERCATLFRGSRFYADPFYPREKADELHRRWIRNCFHGRAAAFLVADDANGQPAGFVTCAVDHAGGTGTIDLIGVAESAQGKGMGGRLLAASLGWFAPRVRAVRVKTQATNYAAASIYEAAGFRLRGADLTLSRVLGGQAKA